MVELISKMNVPDSGQKLPNRFWIPIPRKKAPACPTPKECDLLFVWLNGIGLVLEARILEYDQVASVVAVDRRTDFPEPFLGDAWLKQGRQYPGTLRDRLRRVTTQTAGTTLLTCNELYELDEARRDVVTNS